MKSNFHTTKTHIGFDVGSQAAGPFAPSPIRRPQIWQSTALWMPFDRNHFTPVVSFGLSSDRLGTCIHYFSLKTGCTALPSDRFNQRYCYYLKATTTESYLKLMELRRGLLNAADLIGLPATMRHDLAFLIGVDRTPSPIKGLFEMPGYQIARG